jgi:GTP cyclohydrolase I
MEQAKLERRQAALSNEPIIRALSENERQILTSMAAKKIEELFDVLLIDHKNDHNTRETPSRVAKMLVEETLRGRYCAPPTITEFENVTGYDQLIVMGPIHIRSTCAHHMMPIYGHAIIGVVPSQTGSIIGISKYDRIVDYVASRLQIQEELVKQIEQHIVSVTGPRGLAVRVNAVHMCKCHRGIKSTRSSRMVNSSYYGSLSSDSDLRSQFNQEAIAIENSVTSDV